MAVILQPPIGLTRSAQISDQFLWLKLHKDVQVLGGQVIKYSETPGHLCDKGVIYIVPAMSAIGIIVITEIGGCPF